MLVIQMHGLPGSGKSTVARVLGRELGAVVLDKDVIKASLLRSGIEEAIAAPGAYEVYFAQAGDLVLQGHSVILDNPVFWPRVEERWLALTSRAGSPRLLIECVCADLDELQRRLDTREALESQPRGLFHPRRFTPDFEPGGERLTLDTTRPLDDLIYDALTYVRTAVPV